MRRRKERTEKEWPTLCKKRKGRPPSAGETGVHLQRLGIPACKHPLSKTADLKIGHYKKKKAGLLVSSLFCSIWDTARVREN